MAFDLGSILGVFGLSSMASPGDWFSGWKEKADEWGDVAKKNGWDGVGKVIDFFKDLFGKAGDLFSSFFNSIIGNFAPNDAAAKKGLDAQIDHTENFKLKGKIVLSATMEKDLHDIAKTAEDDFIKNGTVPALDEYKRPAAAYTATYNTKEAYKNFLLGVDDTHPGYLTQKYPELAKPENADLLNKTADDIIFGLVGVHSDATVASITASPPTTALGKTFVDVQTKVNAANASKATIKDTDITLSFDDKFVEIALDDIKKGSVPAAPSTNHPGSPPPGGNKPNTQHLTK